MVSSCSVCAIICFRAAESLWTQKFFKPSSISNRETKWAFLLWNGCAVQGDITCLVWTASRRSALFSAAPDAPWQSSSVGTYPPKAHILMGMASRAAFWCPFEVCYLWQVLCEVHQPVCAPLPQQFLLRLPALYDRQAFLNLKEFPGGVTSGDLSSRISNFCLAHPQHLPLAISPMPQFNFSLHIHKAAHRPLSVHFRHSLPLCHSGLSFCRVTPNLSNRKQPSTNRCNICRLHKYTITWPTLACKIYLGSLVWIRSRPPRVPASASGNLSTSTSSLFRSVASLVSPETRSLSRHLISEGSTRGCVAADCMVSTYTCRSHSDISSLYRSMGRGKCSDGGQNYCIFGFFSLITCANVLRCSSTGSPSVDSHWTSVGSTSSLSSNCPSSPRPLTSLGWDRISELSCVIPASSAPWSLSSDGLPQARVISEPWFSWSWGQVAALLSSSVTTVFPVSSDTHTTSK